MRTYPKRSRRSKRSSRNGRLTPLPRSIDMRPGSRNVNSTEFYFLRTYFDLNMSTLTGNATYAFTTNLITLTNFSELNNFLALYQEQLVSYIKVTWVPAAWLVNGTGDSLTLGTGGSVGGMMTMAASNSNTVPSLTPAVLLSIQNCKFRPVGLSFTHIWRNPKTGGDATFYNVGSLMPQFGGVYLAYDGPVGTVNLYAGSIVVEVGMYFRTRV